MTKASNRSKTKAKTDSEDLNAQPELQFLTKSSGPEARRGNSFYSRFVRFMRLFLPVSAAILLGAILVWPQLKTEANRFRLGLGLSGVDSSHPDRLKVVNANFQGTDSKGQPFNVTAETAYEDQTGAKDVVLDVPAADLTQMDGTLISSQAPEGSYNRDTELLKLWGGVIIFHDKGYTFETPTAQLMLKDGRAVGQDPAIAYGPDGEIRGQDGFEILDKGRRILFKGKSRLILHPGGKFHVSRP